MSKICTLFSGSSGNCTYIENKGDAILIDAGVSAKRITQALNDRNLDIGKIKAVFVTHEHSDHVKGIGVASRKYSIPIYATVGTHEKMEVGNLHEKNIKYISPDLDFEIGDIGITPFSIPHDAANPVAYCNT